MRYSAVSGVRDLNKRLNLFLLTYQVATNYYFFLLSLLASCLFLMTHCGEIAPENILSGFIHKGQRRQLDPILMNPARARVRTWPLPVLMLFSHTPAAPFLLPWQCPWRVRTMLFLSNIPPPHPLVSRRELSMH